MWPDGSPVSDGDSQPVVRSRRVLWLVACGAVVAISGIVVWLIITWNSPRHTVKGIVVVYDSDFRFLKENVPCEGKRGYDDMVDGGAVTIKSGKGETLAVGNIKGGLVTASHGCGFIFEVPDVADSDFYRIAVGHRDGVEFSRGDLAAQGWIATLSLGH